MSVVRANACRSVSTCCSEPLRAATYETMSSTSSMAASRVVPSGL